MKEALLLGALVILIPICVVILVKVSRDILGALSGNLDTWEEMEERKTEERKNERIRKEIQQWREGK